uniref:Uncharacterized protein n=1 Tax=Cacopsylla melanoneura TaxID=428564 RepID=A0A8D8S9H7_9HEMI
MLTRVNTLFFLMKKMAGPREQTSIFGLVPYVFISRFDTNNTKNKFLNLKFRRKKIIDVLSSVCVSVCPFVWKIILGDVFYKLPLSFHLGFISFFVHNVDLDIN